MEVVLGFGQNPTDLASGDVDAHLKQLLHQQGLGNVLVVILVDDETDQVRSKMTMVLDVVGQWGYQVLAVGTLPAFAAVTDHPRLENQLLYHEVFVTLED